MTHQGFAFLVLTLFSAQPALSQDMNNEHTKSSKAAYVFGPLDCGQDQTWDTETGMCMPIPQKAPDWMTMVHANGFLVSNYQSGPRGRKAFTSPNMIMGNFGKKIAEGHFLNLNVMLTAERWTFPEDGYPLVLQIGEHNEQGKPYIDGQHPHSSPLMGLTLSETIALDSEQNYVKFFMAPRGQPTDGPIAFMHRPSGMFNPDAPLGHHIGQDVAHITSTVLGASLKIDRSRYQVSVFNGTEPEPAKVDLPLGTLNSFSGRYVFEPDQKTVWMISGAYIKNPEPSEPQPEARKRFSGSLYRQLPLENDCVLHNSLIVGAITDYDDAPILWSLNEEAALVSGANRPWFRFEILQRNAKQLQIPSVSDQTLGRWNGLLSLGYNRVLFGTSELEGSIGVSGSLYAVAPEFENAYTRNPWGAKIYFQLGGMKMWVPESRHQMHKM